MEIWRYFLAGGHVMWFLLACSIFAVMVGAQRIRFFKQACISQTDEMELTQLLKRQNWEKASLFVADKKDYMSSSIKEALQAPGPKEREVSFENGATILIHRMHEGLRYLDTIVTLSPLLGLLGTVLGMIQSFQVLNVKEGNMNVITGGVAEALVATAFGLIVAVLALCIHSYLIYRLDRSVTTLEEWGSLLQDRSECRL